MAGRWASIGPAFVLTGVALGPAIAGVVSRVVDAMVLFLCAQRLRVRDVRARLGSQTMEEAG